MDMPHLPPTSTPGNRHTPRPPRTRLDRRPRKQKRNRRKHTPHKLPTPLRKLQHNKRTGPNRSTRRTTPSTQNPKTKTNKHSNNHNPKHMDTHTKTKDKRMKPISYEAKATPGSQSPCNAPCSKSVDKSRVSRSNSVGRVLSRNVSLKLPRAWCSGLLMALGECLNGR